MTTTTMEMNNATMQRNEDTSLAEVNNFDFKSSEEKLDAIRGHLLAMDDAGIGRFNLNVPIAVSYAMRLYKAFDADRHLFTASIRESAFNPADYDNFPSLVGALWHADIMLNQTIESSAALPRLVEKSKVLYKKFDTSARYLWKDHQNLGDVVESIRDGMGYMHMADALARYGVLFMENWDDANGNCSITLADIEAAKDYSAQLVVSLTDKDDDRATEYRILRNRAGECLRRSVFEIRSAARYVFRNSPNELSRYPSLFTGRSTRRNKLSKSSKPAAPQPDTTTTSSNEQTENLATAADA